MRTIGEPILAALLLVGMLILPIAGHGRPVEMKVVAARDVWVSEYPDELDTSMGKTLELKLKANTEVALLDFDLSALRGKRVTAAELWVHNVPEAAARETARLGVPGRPDCLRKIGLSTVGSEWEEGSQAEVYKPDSVGHGATYNQASHGRRDWAYPGSKLWAVTMGNGHSMHWHVERAYQGNGWWKVPVEPRLIAAMASGLSCGLELEEESGSGGEAANNFVHSRESGEYAPYLMVTAEESGEVAPDAPTGLAVAPAPEFATLTHGAARISLAMPPGAMGYLVSVNGTRVPAWRVPYATGEERQAFVLEDLPPGDDLRVEVRVVGGTALISDVATTAGRASEALAIPDPLPAVPFEPAAGAAKTLQGPVRLWAFPEVTKVDAVTGEALFEPTSDLREANAVWDGSRGLVRLAAARGEIAAFQLAVESAGPLGDIRVDVSDLRGPDGTVSREQIRLFRVWYVKAGDRWQGEYAIPLTGGFDLPAGDNAVSRQTVQAVYVDVVVPKTAAAGTYRGQVAVTAADAGKVTAEVELVVYPVTIPDEMSFNPELNSYGPPGGEVGSAYFYEAHRLAHYNRCTINTVPYSQGGNMTPGYAPKLEGKGAGVHVADWSEFDRLIGPLLDGSAFASNPRARVPVKTFYLPLSEHWPLSLWEYYQFRGSPKDRAVMVRHMFEAPPIGQAFPPEYGGGFEQVTRDLVGHVEAKGWTATDFQMYLNNKYDWGGTYWTLDEPSGRDDWQALRFWARLFKRGTQGAGTTHFVFRGDVSRPWWQYDQLDRLMDTIHYNNEIFDVPEFARHYNRRISDPHVYGACNEVSASNHESALWCLKAYGLGLNGVLPWQSIGDEESLRKPDATALIVPGKLGGYDGPVASLRVLALRRGAQDVELLRLLAAKKGYSSDQTAAVISQKLDLGAQFRQEFPEEAAGLTFGQASAQAFAELKEGVLILLSQ